VPFEKGLTSNIYLRPGAGGGRRGDEHLENDLSIRGGRKKTGLQEGCNVKVAGSQERVEGAGWINRGKGAGGKTRSNREINKPLSLEGKEETGMEKVTVRGRSAHNPPTKSKSGGFLTGRNGTFTAEEG